jgi:hypothetical protein
LILESEYRRDGLSGVVARGQIDAAPAGSIVAVEIAQNHRRLILIAGFIAFWFLAIVLTIVGLVRHSELGALRAQLMLLAASTFGFLPYAAKLWMSTPNKEAGPATLEFLQRTLDASLTSIASPAR